jgi:hypothetical protein
MERNQEYRDRGKDGGEKMALHVTQIIEARTF